MHRECSYPFGVSFNSLVPNSQCQKAHLYNIERSPQTSQISLVASTTSHNCRRVQSAAGEEVTISYLGRPQLAPAAERIAKLKEDYGFECGCPRCLSEAGAEEKVRGAVRCFSITAQSCAYCCSFSLVTVYLSYSSLRRTYMDDSI